MTKASSWLAVIRVSLKDRRGADRLARTLAPEAARETPRARAILVRRTRRSVTLTIEAGKTGPMRAALNTHLGWLALVRETDRSLDGRTEPA